MLLADLGANVLRIERAGATGPQSVNPVLNRGRAGSVRLDLKTDGGRASLLTLVERADALIEGFRPGVMESLGLGPEPCLERNPRLVYGRITGWGRHGPLAPTAGHDINYIALSGALHAIGTAESGPVPPLNLVGDFGGGGMLLAFGIVSALLESRSSGRGQTVDAAMLDGASLLMAMMYGYRGVGKWQAPRAGNMFDGSAYYYRCYRCADGEWLAVGAIEPQFRQLFLAGIGLESDLESIMSAADGDPQVHARIAAIIGSQTRSHWQNRFEGTDACVSPVLAMSEVAQHPHNEQWGTFQMSEGVVHPCPAPRFSRTPPSAPAARERATQLAAWGLNDAEFDRRTD
jgi:alpha-methylacyl-CoA racemase